MISALYYYGANYGFDPDVFYPMMSALEGSTVVGAVIGADPRHFDGGGHVAVLRHLPQHPKRQCFHRGPDHLQGYHCINLVLSVLVVLSFGGYGVIFIIAFAGMGEINYYSYSDGYYGATSAAFVITLLVLFLWLLRPCWRC